MSEEQFILIERRSRGIEIHVKVDPMVEEVVKAVMDQDGGAPTNLEAYGRYWLPLTATPIRVYSIDRVVDGANYFLGSIGGQLRDSKNRINISFLQFVGSGGPDGVKFLIAGPVSRDVVIEYGGAVRKAVEAFLRDYLDQARIKINISLTQR